MEVYTIGNSIGTLDILVLSCFLVANVILGIFSRNKCWDINETVFGKKSKFSNIVLMTSMSATIVDATLLTSDIQQINIKGLPIIIVCIIMYPAMYFIISFFMIDRIVFTKMAFSWFEYIGEKYGNIIRVIFAICNVLLYIGDVAALFLMMNDAFILIFNCPTMISKTVASFAAIILIFYSSFGGLRAVTITDIFQFIVFFVVVIFIALYFWVSNPQMHSNFINLFNGSNPKLTWSACFGSPEVAIATLSYWAAHIIPDFPEALYQRCYASKSLKKAKKNMFLASVILLIFSAVTCFIALQVMATNNKLELEQVLPFFVDKLSLPGLKGLFCAAILAMAISTADSELNASAIVFANDIWQPLKNCNLTPSLIRKTSLILGFIALVFSFYFTNVLDVFMTIIEYTTPLNSFSFLAIVFGLKTSKNVIYISMVTGITPVLIYHFLGYEDYACILGLLGNLLGLVIAHLIWKKYFRSDDPNMYYNKKDSFKRLKDFEYDDDLMSYTEYKLKSGEWKEDLEEALRKQNEEEENAELQKRFHAIVKERMRSVVEEYDREKAEDEAYNRSLQEKKAQDYDRSIYKEKDATKDFYELKDLPETCAAYGIIKKAGHKMCRQDILNQYINESWQWKRNHPEDLNGPNNIYNDSIPVPEKIFGIKIMPKKEGKNEDPMQNITVDDFVDLRKRFKKAVKEKMEEMGLKYVPDIEDELELMKNEQENEQKIVKKYKELWLEEIRKEQEEEKKNKKK